MKLKRQLVIVSTIIFLTPFIVGLPIYRSFETYQTAKLDEKQSIHMASLIYTKRLIADDYIMDKSERASSQWYKLQDDLEALVESNTMSIHSEEEATLLTQINRGLSASRKTFDQLTMQEMTQTEEESERERISFLANQLTVTAQETIQATQRLYTINQEASNQAFQQIITILGSAVLFYLLIVLGCFYLMWLTAGKLELIDRMKSEFISLASHQLKTPITSMRWYSEILLNQFGGSLKGEQREYLETVYKSVLHMNDLVNTLLNISRIESGRLMVRPKKTDIPTLINDLIKELQPKFTERNAKFVLDLEHSLPIMMVDQGLLRQIYINLLTNAIKYSPEGKTVTLTVKSENGSLVSIVRDEGYGIPTKDYGRVFEKFYRGENILKKGSEGTGLGLYLIKTIITSFGGKIWFKSQEGSGTTFTFTVPMAGMKEKVGVVGLS